LNFPELIGEGLEPWKVRQVLVAGVERPNLWIDVADCLEVALAALRCHASQVSDWAEVEERVRDRARESGEAVGMTAAQSFLSILLT
jgi:LmbE family N-acetylglucosaminyl deacetylase